MRRLFLHQDGFAVAAALGSMEAIDALASLQRGATVADVIGGSSAPGAIAAGLRALQSAGLVSVDAVGGQLVTRFEEKYSAAVAPLVDVVLELESVLGSANWEQDESVLEAAARVTPTLRRVLAAMRADSSLGDRECELATRYAEGVVATPFLPRLRHVDTNDLSQDCDGLLDALGLGSLSAPSRLADGLKPFVQVYGLMGSYVQPALAVRRWLSQPSTLPTAVVTSQIDRRLNVLASGNAHMTYFAAAQALLRRLFDDQAYADQPKAIVDVGCGDGSWLRAMSRLIDRTSRGRVRDRYPLLLIGVDVDERALNIAENRCRDLPAVFLRGDIGQPDRIHQEISHATGFEADELLHVRAFVDHNRAIGPTSDVHQVVEFGDTISVDADGYLVPAQAIQADWVRHYSNWRDYIGRHGLLVIEGHTLPPEELARRRGGAHALAFEYYHGISGQSPVSYPAFQDATRDAGLVPVYDPLTFQRGETPTTSVQLLGPDTGR